MDWNAYRQSFIEEARKQGRTEAYLAKNLAYAERLVTSGLPIIYDAKHLSELLGYQYEVLLSAIKDPSPFYISFYIAKRGPGRRKIDQPMDSLMGIQQWILEHIINRCVPHRVATAFTRGRSIKLNAAPHVAKPQVLSLDVKDFFSSIQPSKIVGVFMNMGYTQEVAEALAGLTVLGEGLPQGAPTSPALSNLVMIEFDKKLSSYTKLFNINYTRYADDLTFSGRFDPGHVILFCRFLLHCYGLKLNESKTRLMLPHQRQEVTGVIVNKKIQAPRLIRRQLRQEIYFIAHHGLTSHEQRVLSLYSNRLDHLRGLAEFILFLNPQDRDATKAISLLGRYGTGDTLPTP